MRAVSFRWGFTLLEIVVAMAIFSALVAILGKFFHRSAKKVVSDQESVEYQLQCGRLIRLLEGDLRFMPPEKVIHLSANVHAWIKYFDDDGIEGPVYCVYALDAQGDVHRVLLHENPVFSPAPLVSANVVASGFGEFSIVQIPGPDACINVRVGNRSRTATRSLAWFPEER